MSRNPVLTNRIFIENSFNVCYYCGEPAHYLFENGRWCCSKYHQQCQKNRTTGAPSWNKGLTKDLDSRVKQNAIAMKNTKQNNNYIAWNKGLTKETDIRIKQYGLNVKKAKLGKPNFKNRKPINKERGLSASEFKWYLNGLLYTAWKFPVMERDEFKCCNCNSNENLEVHHLIPNRIIFKKSVELNDLDYKKYYLWNNDDFEKIIKTYLNLHILDIGITVCKKCHCSIDPYRLTFIKRE